MAEKGQCLDLLWKSRLARKDDYEAEITLCRKSPLLRGLALGRSAYSAALPLFSSDAPYELLFFRQPLNATTELLSTCDTLLYPGVGSLLVNFCDSAFFLTYRNSHASFYASLKGE
jgi:hypothetical protein